jgi:hypothetical protein
VHIDTWKFRGHRPNKRVLTRARAITLAVGPLRDGGPESVRIIADARGGVAITFIQRGADATTSFFNDGRIRVILGPAFGGGLRMFHFDGTSAQLDFVIAEVASLFQQQGAQAA